ncbi:ketoacyl-ACP synthase III [bacterium]|nr:ketoacyl-ACP synthase III [bacterium]
MRKAFISGLGGYVPEKVLTNYDLEKMVDTSDEWIRERTGIAERRIASKDCATSDLAIEASRMAIERASLKPQQIDLIICATVTPDNFFPSTACQIQKALGNNTAAAFDLSAACSGFIYGLSIANLFVCSGAYDHILLIGAETLSKVTDWEDRSTCVLFGDGAGAVVVSPAKGESSILSVHIFSDGQFSDCLEIPGGGSRNPCTHDSIDKRLHYIRMKGNETFKIAVKSLVNASVAALEHNKISAGQIDLFISHQANDRIIQAAAQRLNVPAEKVVINLDRFGNTSAASIPIALWDIERQGKLARGAMVLLAAFGGGLTWGSALIRW